MARTISPDGLAYIFDMDGVIVDSHEIHVEAWERYLRLHQISVSDLGPRMHGKHNGDNFRRAHMKTLSMTIAAAALAAAAGLSSVAANARTAGVAEESFAQAGLNGVPAAAQPAPHYEWQYHYVGRHGRIEGHWVLVR